MTIFASSPRPLRLTEPGELIAAIPALLGFTPSRSVIVVSLTAAGDVPGTAVIGAVMRHDLVLPDDAGGAPDVMGAAFARFGAVCARDGADAVLVVLVDDRLDLPDGPGVNEARRIVDVLTHELARHDVDVVAVRAVPEIDTGQVWFALSGATPYDEATCGTVPDPTASPVAAARVFDGGLIRGSRTELAALLEPLPMPVRSRVAEYIDGAVDTRDLAYETAVRAGGRDHADRVEFETVLDRIADLDRGIDLPAPDVAELAVLLSNPTVRDASLALAAGPFADAAERMWITLTRSLPDPERAEAAALVGFGAYVRGDGPFAGVALGVALEANPRHRLADLLDQALQAGLRPGTVRGLAETGYEIAARLGVALPPPDPSV